MHDNHDHGNDSDLVVQTLAGQREAFGRLYDRYARLVRAIASDVSSDVATVQDLTQECFLRAYRQLPTLRDQQRFGPWLVGIARQIVREYRRRHRTEPLGDQFVALNDAGASEVEHADELSYVLRLLGQLPEQERLAIHFFFLNEHNADETARLLNRSRSGFYALLKRACGRLARLVSAPEPQREIQP